MSYIPCAILSPTQKNRISIEQEHCRLMELVAIPAAVALLQCTDVLGCGCSFFQHESENHTFFTVVIQHTRLGFCVGAATNLMIVKLTWNVSLR